MPVTFSIIIILILIQNGIMLLFFFFVILFWMFYFYNIKRIKKKISRYSFLVKRYLTLINLMTCSLYRLRGFVLKVTRYQADKWKICKYFNFFATIAYYFFKNQTFHCHTNAFINFNSRGFAPRCSFLFQIVCFKYSLSEI